MVQTPAWQTPPELTQSVPQGPVQTPISLPVDVHVVP
jgi:hypothetical protein